MNKWHNIITKQNIKIVCISLSYNMPVDTYIL